jgi:alcohol dehydrogenase class IV
MRILILAAAAGLCLPAVVSAQDSAAQQRALEAQQRMLNNQRSLQIYEQNQRIEQVQQQVDNLDHRVRTNDNLRSLDAQRASIPIETPQLVLPAAPATPAQLAEAERRRQASLAASEERLRMLSEQQNR